MPKESIRTFIALETDEKIKEKIIEIQDNIKQTNSLTGKWVERNNLHLTLKFLGDTKLKNIDQIKEKIKESIKTEPAIHCTLNHIGAFPNERYPRVIWVGIEDANSQIANLAKKLEEGLCKLGFEKENREFKTHITICRLKQILNQNQFSYALEEINKNFKPIEFIIDKITFFESKLTPKGPIYSAISNYKLP